MGTVPNMETPYVEEDEEAQQLYELAGGYFAQGDHIKALEVIEDSILANGKDKVHQLLNLRQGNIFHELAIRPENTDVKFAFLLASVECFSENDGFSSFCAVSLFRLASLLGSSLYYKKSVDKAKEYLSIMASFGRLNANEQKSQMEIQSLLKLAESRIPGANSLVGSPMKICETKVRESKKNPDPRKDEVQRLRSYWACLNLEIRRNLMKVSTEELTSYVERLYGREGRYALEQVLTSAREDRKWRFWMCRTCSDKFSTPAECKNHLEQEHAVEFKPSSTKAIAQRISKVWARKITCGGWEPVDAVAAVEMIKNRLEDVIAFAYENGWSKDWPLAADEERSKLLQEIKLLLVSFCDRKILSCSGRDLVMHFVVTHFKELEVSKHVLTECLLLETPQSICFLESHELHQILEFLKNIKCERDDGTYLVCRAVDSFCNDTRVKEKIDFDPQFSFLLLDKRLLQCKIARFDDEGTINVFDPNVHYAKAHAHGDDILSWLADHSSGDERFRFPRPIRAHNLDIWVAILRVIQFTCRTLETKYAEKFKLGHFNEVLINTKNLCIREDERRRNIPEDQGNMYASLLCDKYEKLLRTVAGNSLETRLDLSAVRDVLVGVSYPTFDFPDSEDSLNVIREHKNLSDDKVLNSIDHLKLVVTNKVPLIDSKILLIENSRINLLNDLTRLSVFYYRSYILRPLKEFLLDGIVDVESKAKLAAAKAHLLIEEENNPQSKKKKNKRKKKTSTSMSCPLDKTVEHEHSVNLEPEGTHSSERGQFEISSNTDNQEEAATGDPGCKRAFQLTDMPEENSLLKHLESAHGAAATRRNSALEMTLKALCNIKVLKEYLVHNQHQFPDNLEEQVPCALQNFFTAFVSKQIKEEGLYSYLLGNLLASLEEVHSMSRNAAELLISILEFWPCWKSPQIESLATRLFTLEEYERMSCSKCRKKPNYTEQSSYGIVTAADSIRDLKCAFGNIKFEDILKVIRMEDKMLCDIKTGGCGKANFVHHIISRCPPIFTVVLEWEKNETEKEISETTKALEWEIDISRLYEGLELNTKYRLVSMVGCREEEEHICLAYKKNRWVSLTLRHEALAKEGVGNWKSVVRFCGERKVRPEILFYEAARLMAEQVTEL